MPSHRRAGFAATLAILLPTSSIAQPPLGQMSVDASSVVGLDFQSLSNIKVSSVAKNEESLMDTAAAVTVITGEEIRRCGVATLPEALRLAPGLQVARAGSSTWAISSRGFNGTIANKLLVLIDGRSVYTPLYSGVFWDVQDVALGHIDRIEVIRGPGAAVWGANAVNGVINIIRKPAAETQGGRVGVGVGTEERAFGGIRYGGALGRRGHYRAYAKAFERDDQRNRGGGGAQDEWRQQIAGFRADWRGAPRDSFVLSADAYIGEASAFTNINTLTPPFQVRQHDDTRVSGGNVSSSWSRRLPNRSKLQLQLYYDRTNRHIPRAFKEDRDTYSAEFQHQFPFGGRQKIIWGLGYRASRDNVEDANLLDFDPDSHTAFNSNFFVQDEIQVHRRVLLTVGSKFEDTEYTGLEIQPNARLAWMVNPRHTLWTSISRAVRTPARLDRDLRLSAVTSPAPLTTVSVIGTKGFDSEKLTAYEAGYRAHPARDLYLDFAGFYNVYSRLRSFEPGAPFAESVPPPPHTVIPFYIDNGLEAESYGIEINPSYQIFEWWRLQAQYSYLHLRLHVNNGSRDTTSVASEGNDPKHQFSFRSSLNLPFHLELDAAVRYVDNLRNLNVGSYTVGDLRVGWRGIPRLNLELVAQNLFIPHHQEFSPGSEVESGFFTRMSLDF